MKVFWSFQYEKLSSLSQAVKNVCAFACFCVAMLDYIELPSPAKTFDQDLHIPSWGYYDEIKLSPLRWTRSVSICIKLCVYCTKRENNPLKLYEINAKVSLIGAFLYVRSHRKSHPNQTNSFLRIKFIILVHAFCAYNRMMN